MREYLTPNAANYDRSAYWNTSVTEALFPLSIDLIDPNGFNGQLKTWDFGTVSLAHFVAGGVRYKRNKNHLERLNAEELLISFSLVSESTFTQNDVSLRFKQNGFVVQRSSAPYEFEHANTNELFALKVRAEDFKHHVRSIDRFTPHVFDASRGIGGLLLHTLRALPERLSQTDKKHHWRIGGTIVELLAHAVEADDRVLMSHETTVQRAHLGRIEIYVRQNIRNPDLTTDDIANACGISTRYLHELFSQNGQTIGKWIREVRLEMAREQICDGSRKDTIAEIAYRSGFSDQAHFSRSYKAFFGESPREARARATTN